MLPTYEEYLDLSAADKKKNFCLAAQVFAKWCKTKNIKIERWILDAGYRTLHQLMYPRKSSSRRSSTRGGRKRRTLKI